MLVYTLENFPSLADPAEECSFDRHSVATVRKFIFITHALSVTVLHFKYEPVRPFSTLSKAFSQAVPTRRLQTAPSEHRDPTISGGGVPARLQGQTTIFVRTPTGTRYSGAC